MSVVFINGKFLDEKQAHIPILDRGFLFGDGIFTTLRVAEGSIEGYSEHLELFKEHCQQAGISEPTIDPSWLEELVIKNQALKGNWRLKILVTGGEIGRLDLAPRDYGILSMILKPYELNQEKPIKLTLFPQPISYPVSQVKSLSYLDRLWIKEFARKQAFDDACTLSAEGFLLETAFSNIFWRRGDRLSVPDPSLSLMHGATIRFAAKAAGHLGMSVEYAKEQVGNIPTDAQMYICNSLQGIQAVSSIDHYIFKRDFGFESSFQNKFRELILQSSINCI